MSEVTEIQETVYSPQESPPDQVSTLIAQIASEFEVAMGSQSRVKAVCTELAKVLETAPVFPDRAQLQHLVSAAGKRTGAMVEPLFDLLVQLSGRIDEPWFVLEGMLNVRDSALVLRALERTLRLAETGKLLVDLEVLQFFAERLEREGSPISQEQHLKVLARIIQLAALPLSDLQQDPLVWLYLSPYPVPLRQLAARILDAEARSVSPDLVGEVLGEEAARILAPYLAFTRATHLDLLFLIPFPDQPPLCLNGVKAAEQLCGSQLLREVISELGWGRFNFGLDASKCVSISVGGSFPLIVSPAEASLFDGVEEARRTGEYYLFIAHGGLPVESRKTSGEDDLVSRFRSYNVIHSEVLADILDVAPLTREKVERILEKMDRIVNDFTVLFAAYAEESTILPALYRDLRARIVSELEKETSELQLSAELTRLVQMFEDPASLGAVRTLHGLKRYLHQRGLRLGFRLVESGRATNRTVTLTVASPKRIVHTTRDFQYVNFGSERSITALTEIPYPVKVVIDGFSRQILHGLQRLPGVRVFCYGNEVHYYLTFLNHPAFLRIDYSPPLRGGMIDLEYYGVSKNELDLHPNIGLDAIQQFFLKLEYDVRVENTRVHARYDKERALSLGDICEKAEALFRLAPYLMEIDWVIGSLELPDEAKKGVTDAWARFFVRWGVLPVDQMLTRNRLGILVAVDPSTSGEREIVWSGDPPYRDRFTRLAPEGLFPALRSFLHELGQEVDPLFEEGSAHELGQIYLENMVLLPLRKAVMRGEIIETATGYRKSPPELFERRHEAEFFAEILAAEDEISPVSPSLAAIMAPLEGDHPIPLGVRLSSFVLAHLVAPLERTLRFQTSGSLNGYEVQRAAMALSGKELGLYVLRDGAGIIRLAMFSHGESLYLRRQHPAMRWQSNGSIDPAEFAEFLWLNNYLTAGMESVKTDVCIDADEVLSCFQRINPQQRLRPIPGDNVIEGLKASPGRALAKVLFGTRGRQPEDFHDTILVAPAITPEDNSFLYHSAGVVSIGGGILSHAGLIAVQFHKPALIISARWHEPSAGPPFLLYSTVEYREEEKTIHGYQVSIRRDVYKRERRLQEGDLVVLNADDGRLRVLGQDREVLSLHESIRHFGEAGRHLARVTEEKEILVLRGRRLRARHQIEKHLTQLKTLLLAHQVVQELFVGKDLAGDGGTQNEKSRFLSLLLANPHVGGACRDFVFQISLNLQHRYHDRSAEGRQRIPLSTNPYEILSLRLQVMRLFRALEETSTSLQSCSFEPISCDTAAAHEISELARTRLEYLRGTLEQAVEETVSSGKTDFHLRHFVRQIQRLDTVLETPQELRSSVDHLRNTILQNDRLTRQRLQDRWILGPADGGVEIYTAIGWKAANLAEIERLGGRHLVPLWFVVANQAFQEVLNAPLDKTLGGAEGFPPEVATVSDAVDTILARQDLNNSQKSRQIRQLWGRISIPQAIAAAVAAAYERLSRDAEGSSPDGGEGEPFVAIRSSGREEDTENFTRAGEFETFLYIRGREQLLEYLKRAWSGLWTERAIHNRAVLGTQLERVVGGIIIQRNAWSRVSGVLQTVNIAEDKLREMVINVGLGLGEGIVSGTVAADQIVVAKTDNLQNAPLRFRYITSDKREQVVFNARAGYGTIRLPTLYHQRLRPALEYVELVELVAIADRLEAAYGHPLDIEFGIEGAKLWILQARPVGTFPALLRETTQQYPFSVRT